MKYMGSKNRIAKDIVDVILDREYIDGKPFYFFEPFCGGLHISQKLIDTIHSKGGAVDVLASDANVFITALWELLKRKGDTTLFPRDIPKDFYSEKRTLFNGLMKKNRNELSELTIEDRAIIGWCSIVASNKGRGFSGGYSGQYNGRDYVDESIRNIEKQISSSDWLQCVTIDHSNMIGYENYQTLDKPMVIYCDIPYRDTKPYEFSKNFDYNKFYDWCIMMKQQGHSIYVSEYEIPDERFECIWEKEITVAVGNTATYRKSEKLFVVC